MTVLSHAALAYAVTATGRGPMIFQDGELRPLENNKPKLFDGWAYVPMEPKSAAVEAELIAKDALATRDALSVSSPE